MDLESFPRIDEVRKSIKKIKSKGLPIFSSKDNVNNFVEQIRKIITNEFNFYLSPLQPFKHKNFNLTFFRARNFDSFTNINLIREHSYPPIDKTQMGRCNFPKHPVFYCSSDAMTSLIEAAKNDNHQKKSYLISKWEIHKNDNNLIFQTFLQSELPEDNIFKPLQENIKTRMYEPFENENIQLEESRKLGLLEYLRFLDQSFIDDNNYSLSASLAHYSLYADHNYRTDILMYPSVQTLSKSVNIALSPNFVENNLYLSRLYKVTFDSYNPKTSVVSINIQSYAEVDKNVFIWKNLSPDDHKYKEMIEKDFGTPIKNESIKRSNK